MKQNIRAVRFLSENDTLKQFWNSLKGLAAKRKFGPQDDSLVKVICNMNMNRKAVREKILTQPEGKPNELKFYVAFQEVIKRHVLFGHCPMTSRTEKKWKPVTIRAVWVSVRVWFHRKKTNLQKIYRRMSSNDSNLLEKLKENWSPCPLLWKALKRL